MATASAFPTVDDSLVARYDVPAPRYTSYPAAPAWSPLVGPKDYIAALEDASRKVDAPLSAYVHIPFCRERCTFCGCNVVIARQASTADRYLGALDREIGQVAEHLGRRNKLSQLHWGGGTPTFLEEPQILRLWKSLMDRFELLPGAEVAIEIDPVVTSQGQITLLRQLGFNRLSLGVQDLDPEVQKTACRVQSPADTRGMLELARRLGFRGINFDLIYGLPKQTLETWAHTLSQVLEMRPDRAAVYGFAFLPDRLAHQRRLPVESIPHGASRLRLFQLAYDAFLGAGYEPIGMDHFALPDDELAQGRARHALTRNFQGYSVHAADDVVAFGASAISDVGGLYAQNAHVIGRYEQLASGGEIPTERGFRLSDDDLRRRDLIQKLMCNFWIDLGPRAFEEFAPELEKLRALEKDGLLTLRGSEVELTRLGRIFVRNVASVFDAYLARDQQRFSRAV